MQCRMVSVSYGWGEDAQIFATIPLKRVWEDCLKDKWKEAKEVMDYNKTNKQKAL